jgi:DNA-binding response OmpR family regulator
VDLGLPGGDGFLVMQRLSALQPLSAIPVFVITARSEDDTVERSRAAGALGFFRKPIDYGALLAAVKGVLG